MKSLRKQTGKKKNLYSEPDQFQSLSEKVMDYAKENTTKVLAAAGVVAVLFIIAAGVMYWRQSAKLKVSEQIAKAVAYYDVNSPVPGNKPMSPMERMQKAENMFDKIVNEGSGAGADVALYYKANAEVGLGETDKAISDYKTLIAKSSGNASLATLARYRLAEAYSGKGDTKDAIDTYKSEISSPTDYLKDAAHYGLAQLYQQAGSTQEAVAEFNALRKDFPNSPYTGQAYAYIAQNGGAAALAATAQAAAPAAPAQVKPAATAKK